MKLFAIVFAASLMAIPAALECAAMPASRQNDLVRKYCEGCHTDAARSGGLSLEHFDAAQAAPGLVAMMISKLTSGVALETVKAAASDPKAAALVAMNMKSGALGAAGIPRPDKATVDALINALAAEADRSTEWYVERSPDTTASVVREAPSRTAGEAASYRLIVSCNSETHKGEMQLAWAPAAAIGALSAAVDGEAPVTYRIEGPALAAIRLSGFTRLPVRSLVIKDLFPGQSVEFSFGDLPQAARGCF